MSSPVRLLRAAVIATFVALFSGCAVQRTDYVEAAANAVPPGEGQARLVLLRPRDKDDGSGSRAAIHVNDDLTTGLAYGEFLFVDLAAGPVSIRAAGPIAALGACEVQVELAPRSTTYVDVGPRMSYMVAAAAGSLLGGLVIPAPQAAASVTEAMVGSVVATAAGSGAGAVVAVSAEGRALTCRGPYQLGSVARSRGLVPIAGAHDGEVAWHERLLRRVPIARPAEPEVTSSTWRSSQEEPDMKSKSSAIKTAIVGAGVPDPLYRSTRSRWQGSRNDEHVRDGRRGPARLR